MVLIREMEEKDKQEVLDMMRVFYDSPAVFHTSSDAVLKRDVEDCLGELPFVEGFVFADGEELAGYKGYGYAAVVEILSAALTGGPFLKDLSGKNPDGSNRMYRLGHFFFVINPEFFMGLDTFKKTAGDICRGLRASEKAPGAERIYTAGEKEWLAWQERKDKGVPVGETIQKEIIEIRDKLNLPYHFPFEDQK